MVASVPELTIRTCSILGTNSHIFFASVISIVLLIAGTVSVLTLPSAQYPEITPPTVEVKATYPGANAQVVAR